MSNPFPSVLFGVPVEGQQENAADEFCEKGEPSRTGVLGVV